MPLAWGFFFATLKFYTPHASPRKRTWGVFSFSGVIRCTVNKWYCYDMAAKRIPLNGDEYDALTKARRYYFWQRGELKKVKRGYNKRFRREGKRGLEEQ